MSDLPAKIRRRAGAVVRAARQGAPADQPQDLRSAIAENERLRRRVKQLKSELNQTRASVRDPEPDIALDADVQATIDRVREEKLSFLTRPNLAALAKVMRSIEQRGIEGAVVETGTALGGSAIVLGKAKSPQRPMYVYDVFGLIPPPTEADGADVHERYERITKGEATGHQGDTYYGYREDLLGEVTESFARNGVPAEQNSISLVQGLFQDTIDLDEPIALAHLDGDWYESTMVCLERLAPLIVQGGRIVLDDYFAWSGCRTAVDEYFANRPGWRLERRAKIHAVKL